MLETLAEAFEQLQLEHWITYGTLLGAVRDQVLIRSITMKITLFFYCKENYPLDCRCRYSSIGIRQVQRSGEIFS
jgi:hypothetical protein